jgi:formylglycine-generating enzyme required for sulfatase activity
MHTPEAFLKCVAKALLEVAGDGLARADDNLAEAMPSVARAVWRTWGVETSDADRRADIESLLVADIDRTQLATAEIVTEAPAQPVDELIPAAPGEIRVTAAGVAEEVGVGQSWETRRTLGAYLEQVPAGFRRWLRRPENPSGSCLPDGVLLRQAEDLLPALPVRVARFRFGDTPLPGAPWHLVELLGDSPYSETWKARPAEAADGPTVVLKFFTEGWAARIIRNESLFLDRLMVHAKHPHIIPLRQVYLNSEHPCLEYDYLPAADLAGVVHDWNRAWRRPHPAQIAQIILRLAKTLAFAHRLTPPLVHRALKPANILAQNSQDGRLSFRIADFGSGGVAHSYAVRQALKRVSGLAERTAALRGACTALYYSPEQLRGLDARPSDDVYALGIIWYQLLVGDLTVGRPAGSRWRDHLADQGMPTSLLDLLDRSWHENPEERPRDAGAFATQMATLLNPQGTGTAAARRQELEPAVALQARRVVNAISISFALLPAGTFRMGSPASEAERSDDEGPQHEVTLTQPFYLSLYPITQRQYELVMGHNPSYFQGSKGGSPDFPVENVSWHEAVEFCRKLSALPPEVAAGRTYRLPTEAEWEYACRGGQGTPFSSGLAISSRDANFNGNYPYGQASRGPYLERTSRVGAFPANLFGLYDMHGNVWEWCADYYDRHYYRNSPRSDPQGPPAGSLRVVRGGSCYNIGRFCRSAYRFGISPTNRDLDVGFRVVMAIDIPNSSAGPD